MGFIPTRRFKHFNSKVLMATWWKICQEAAQAESGGGVGTWEGPGYTCLSFFKPTNEIKTNAIYN